MALPAQRLASLAETKAAVRALQRTAHRVSERIWLLLLAGALLAAVVIGRRLVEQQNDPMLKALDSAPIDDEVPSDDEQAEVKAAEDEPSSDWSEVSRRLVT
jgi:hypothetical protein